MASVSIVSCSSPLVIALSRCLDPKLPGSEPARIPAIFLHLSVEVRVSVLIIR